MQRLTAQQSPDRTRDPLADVSRDELLSLLTDCAPFLRPSVMREALIALGGTLVEPGTTSWGPGEFVASVHGVSGQGDTLEDSIAEWMKNCRRIRDFAA